jgi:predicted Zn-dependent peptidase
VLKPINLKNELTVLRLPKSASNSFCIGFVVPTGSSIEEGNFQQGISHLVERLFWCGTDKHPSSKNLISAIEGIGGKFSSLTTQELTQFYLTVPSYNQFKAITLLAEIIQHSFFDEGDLEIEKEFLVEELKNQEYGISDEYSELSLGNIYKNIPLGLPVKGYVDSIMNITLESVYDYLAHQYTPKKSFLVLSGNFDTKPAMELVEQEWTFWNPKNKGFIEQPEFNFDLIQDLPSIEYVQRGVLETKVNLGFILNEGLQSHLIKELENKDASKDPKKNLTPEKILDGMLSEWAVLLILNTILGEGMSSRLWSKTIEDEGLMRSVKTEVIRFKQTGFFQITGIVENSQFTFALESIMQNLDYLRKTTISINELAKSKEYLKGKLILENEDLLKSTVWQIEHLINSELTFEMSDLIEKINKVEAPEIRALAGDIFSTERFFATFYGPAKETKILDKLIKKYLS